MDLGSFKLILRCLESTGEAQRAAEETGITAEEVDYYLGVELPKPTPQADEMEDVRYRFQILNTLICVIDSRWFHYDFLKHNLDEQSDSQELTIPDKHAIANKFGILSFVCSLSFF